MKRFLAKLFVSKKRKELLTDFAELVLEIPKVNSVEDCMEGYRKVGEFAKRLDYKNKNNQPLREELGRLLEYLLDTKTHIHNGYHKPSHNGWKTVNTYPDINDYVNLGIRIKTF